MNIYAILYIIGLVLNFEGAFLLLPCITAAVFRETQGFAYLVTMAICFVIGLPMMILADKKKKEFYSKEGFSAVAICWFIIGIFGALPFWFTHEIPNYVDALFETFSGLTTTGASILNDVEALSKCSLLWRSFTHWIGGMGVFVFVLAVFPKTAGNNIHLMRAESPGPQVNKLVPHLRDTALILYMIYTFLTIFEIILLIIFGMPIYDSICTSFGTAGTGGFGIKNDSLGGYSVQLQAIVTVFMVLFGVNFSFYYLIVAKKLRDALRMEEVRIYLAIIIVSVAAISINIAHMFSNIFEAIHHSFFQVASIITTTGFSTCDFDTWPIFSKTILVLLMFVGACAGSTGGGIKVSRIVVGIKVSIKAVKSYVHPRSVTSVRLDGRVINDDTERMISVYTVIYALIFMVSMILISFFDNFDFTTNFTAIAATFNNIGPGLEKVGPTCNFSIFTDFSKVVMMFDMLFGRLEIFPILVMLSPRTWRC
ncbi:trk system potassium uptake protein TrkH [Acetitomaculum ruminis DSM 5522]|uniref:Trk system potassium uptake protein TrkH n=1 Tax=Acetitomaculum ruminis DSM 5522 TaxID=1120918 RepID=A0A1I0XUU3_9FIRM|nr:TrkH family potassium uptake protein [Acetitomaculum ruminis]SFB03743.1 trk system potassium uptake protein TrkH [Acetitomaculum ruminis DSM 5522]